MKKLGKGTIGFENAPRYESAAAVVGKEEMRGPLGGGFDVCCPDPLFGQKTWEQAEAAMQQTAVDTALAKRSLAAEDADIIFGGDLENQCTASSYGMKKFGLPYAGLYGACSTMALGLALAAVFTGSGAAGRAVAVTSSHFCTAERQFRYPLEYGGQRPPTAQWTVTAGGAAVLCAPELCGNPAAPRIEAVTFGRICELGVTDINNMGAAMAPAAADTILRHFSDTGAALSDCDLIVTGDLGQTGAILLRQLLAEGGMTADGHIEDCGCLIFDPHSEKYGCGGSGCGCSAAVINSRFWNGLSDGTYERILFVGTGALMSPTSVFQGEVIPAVAHAVLIGRA